MNSVIANVPGSFQAAIGCPGDWNTDCWRTWLQDPDGDGIYTYTTHRIPAGDYEAKVALNGTWDENYGADSARDGANVPFTVPAAGHEVTVNYNSTTYAIEILVSEAPCCDRRSDRGGSGS